MVLSLSGIYSRRGETQALDFRLLDDLLLSSVSIEQQQYHMKESIFVSNLKRFGTKKILSNLTFSE